MVEIEEEEVFVCESCGYKTSDIDELVCIDGNLYCDDCYETCDDCGDDVLETYETASGSHICNSCRSDSYVRCENCGELIHQDDIHTYHGDYYCEDCLPSDTIREYHDNPTWLIRSIDDCIDKRSYWSHDERLIGVEMEMQGRSYESCANAMSEILEDESYGCLMHDGSLDCGFEHVSMPMTKEFFDQMYPLDEICKCARKYRMEAHDPEEPGLHVHLSWSWFGSNSQKQHATLLNVVYLLDKYRNDFWLPISRRSEESLNNWCESLNLNYAQSFSELDDRNGHYKIINFRRETVELRLFKGSVQEKSVRAAVELYCKLVELCRLYPFEVIESLSIDEIRSYLEWNTGYVSDYLRLRLKGEFEPVMNLNSKLLLRKVKLQAMERMKFDYVDQSYQCISPVTEEVYHPYRGRYETVISCPIPLEL